MKNIKNLTALQLAEEIKQKKISAEDAVEASFSRMQERERELHAFLYADKDSALKQAKKVQRQIDSGEQKHPLAGIPLAVKDNLCTAGIPTTCGSKMLESFIPSYNATAVEKILAAGMIPVGKTNMDEFAFGSTTETSAYGCTRNPMNTAHVPGGSSGGSAAAVASGEVLLALGTDTGGSIRQPAAHCGIVGLKPTYGSVSRYGMIAYGSSLEQIGPLAGNVADCEALFHTIRGRDDKDVTSRNEYDKNVINEKTDASREWKKNKEQQTLKGKVIAVPKEFFTSDLDPHIKENIENALRLWQSQGALVEECSLRYTEYYVPVYYTIACAEASSNLERYDGVKYGYAADMEEKNLHRWYGESRSCGLGTEAKRRILLGTFVLSAGYYEDYYLQSCKVRQLITDEYKELFCKYDVIVSPVTKTTAPCLGKSLENPIQMYESDLYTIPANLTGMPAISLPCGTDEKGLPIGAQLMADYHKEDDLFQFGHALERGCIR